jgi:hypothetical protein
VAARMTAAPSLIPTACTARSNHFVWTVARTPATGRGRGESRCPRHGTRRGTRPRRAKLLLRRSMTRADAWVGIAGGKGRAATTRQQSAV